MPSLPNARWEAFAQALARGETQAEAYRQVYGKTSYASASTLANRPPVIKRVAELRQKVEAKIVAKVAAPAIAANISKARVAEELAKIAFADISKAVVWGTRKVAVQQQGRNAGAVELTVEETRTFVEFLDSESLPPEITAAISEIKMSAEGAITLKFHDKRAALMDLAKLFGWVIERKEIGQAGEFEDRTDDELAAIIAGRVDPAGRRRQGAKPAGGETLN